MRVDRIDEMRLTAHDEGQIANLLALAFGTDFGGRSYYQQRHHARLVVRDGTQMIGHMGITFRAIRMGNTCVDIAGLAEVATHPEHRGKGLATTLLQAAIADVQQSMASFFLLFGDQPIYRAAGFVEKQNKLRFTACQNVRTGEIKDAASDGLMVMPLSDLDWDDSATIDLVGHAF